MLECGIPMNLFFGKIENLTEFSASFVLLCDKAGWVVFVFSLFMGFVQSFFVIL